jgi:hypothetical protein
MPFLKRRPQYGVVGFSSADDIATTGERYSVYNHKYHKFYKKTELQLMPDYQEQYISNPLATLLIDYVVARLGEFQLAGDPAQVKKAKAHFRELDFKRNFYETMKQMVMNGTGIMVKNDIKGRFRRSATSQWQITRDDKSGQIDYTLSEGEKQTFEWPAGDVRHKDLAVFKVFELPDRPEGISLVRPALPALAALEELVFKDIPAGVHNFLTVERIMKLPLDGYNTPAEQQTFFENMRNRWANRDPSGVGITIIDDKVDVYYMGSEEGTGASGSRVLPILEFIEPILATVMLNFLMPIGLILQSGANKSIIKRQQMEANLRLEIMRRRLEEQLYAQSWPDMGLDPEKCWIVWPKTEAELMDEWVVDREMFERRLISKEFVLTKYGIIDEGTTFYEGVPTQAGDEGDDKEETDSQAENHESVKDD